MSTDASDTPLCVLLDVCDHAQRAGWHKRTGSKPWRLLFTEEPDATWHELIAAGRELLRWGRGTPRAEIARAEALLQGMLRLALVGDGFHPGSADASLAIPKPCEYCPRGWPAPLWRRLYDVLGALDEQRAEWMRQTPARPLDDETQTEVTE